MNERLPALISNGGHMHSFSDAVNLPLEHDRDFDRFVDPNVRGADRELAIYFMKLMPANKRGDFVYVDPHGRVLSNRLSVAQSVAFGHVNLRRSTPTSGHETKIARRGFSKTSNRDNFPPNSSYQGADIRYYSQQGVNALYGYATPPCDVNLPGTPGQGGDAGYMYFNAYSASSAGSLVDAGVGDHITSQYGTNGVVPFVSVYGSGFNNPAGGQWTNSSTFYPCNVPLGMMYGTLPNQGMTMIAVGTPTFDPSQLMLPPTTTTWTTASWNFFNTPSGLNGPTGTWNNIPSNCTTCSVAEMFSLATNNTNDGSCYGSCNGSPDGFWNEVVGGELIAPCSQVVQQSFQCTIEYETDGNGGATWASGENDTANGIYYSEANQQDAVDGINLGLPGNGSNQSSSYSNGKFIVPTPPAPSSTCAPDSDGYCAINMGETQTGSCNTGAQSPHGGTVFVYSDTTKYYVFQKESLLELVETATETSHFGSSHCLPMTETWSPSEPKVKFNDSNLP